MGRGKGWRRGLGWVVQTGGPLHQCEGGPGRGEREALDIPPAQMGSLGQVRFRGTMTMLI